MDIVDKRVVVTGAASGIGKALAVEFKNEKAKDVVLADLNEEVLKVAHKVASKSTALARLAKETVNVSYETTLNEGLRAERAIFMSTFSLEDHKEGMEAFSEKRKPNWKNK